MTAQPSQNEPRESFGEKLAKGTLHYGLGQTLPKVIRFVLLPIYTYYLSPWDFGILEISVALGAALTMIMRLGVPGSLVRFYFDHKEGNSLSHYVTTLSWFIWGWSLVVAAAAAILGPMVLPLVYPEFPIFPYFWLVVIGAVFTANYELQLRLIQARQETALAARLNIIRSCIAITISVILVVGLELGVMGLLLGELFGGAFFLAQSLVYLHKNLGGSFSLAALLPSLRYGLGIFPSHIVGSVAPLILYALLGHFLSMEAVGVWGIAMRFLRPLEMLRNAIGAAYPPMYFDVRQEDDPSKYTTVAKNALSIFTLCLFMVISVIAVFPPLIKIFLPETFHGAALLITIAAPAELFALLYVFLAQELCFQKKTYLIPGITIATSTCQLCLTWLLLPVIGIAAVPLSLLISQTLPPIMVASPVFPQSPITYPYRKGLQNTVLAMGLVAICVFAGSLGTGGRMAVGCVSVVGFLVAQWLLKEPLMIQSVKILSSRKAL